MLIKGRVVRNLWTATKSIAEQRRAVRRRYIIVPSWLSAVLACILQSSSRRRCRGRFKSVPVCWQVALFLCFSGSPVLWFSLPTPRCVLARPAWAGRPPGPPLSASSPKTPGSRGTGNGNSVARIFLPPPAAVCGLQSCLSVCLSVWSVCPVSLSCVCLVCLSVFVRLFPFSEFFLITTIILLLQQL